VREATSADFGIPVTYTPEEMAEFSKLYRLSGSLRQSDRHHSRFTMPGFVKRVGKEKCDAMFEIVRKIYGD
jgi:hypothetical protein